MKIAIASDHAGYEYKEEIRKELESKNYVVTDYGTSSNDAVDYPDFAYSAAKSVSDGINDAGIIICGTGTGMCIVANKVSNIRAASCVTKEMAKLAREHNDANVITLGARLIDIETAKEIVNSFLNTPFEGGRHIRRIEKIHLLTGR